MRLKWIVAPVAPLDWLEPRLSLHILRILQEAFTNVLKHACATEVTLSTRMQGAQVAVCVSDNGVGCPLAAMALDGGAKGLANQRHRARALGAQLLWESGAGGSRLLLLLPVQRAGPAQPLP